ncbi:MAG: putative Ig domain-containing protein [Gammaproteobacteria bacterium]|nr:putative Ig domain-containing protein [Gammaproteobacteria bacterium]
MSWKPSSWIRLLRSAPRPGAWRCQPVRLGRVLSASVLLLVVSACDWVDSTGVQNNAPLLQLEEGQVVELIEGQARTLDPTGSVDPEGQFGSWRWGAQPTQAGALGACASVDGFRTSLAASSVAEACIKDSACGLFFEPQTGDDGRALFRLIPPQLKAPVGVQYQLIGTNSAGVERRGNFTFCLIAVNEAPDAADDVFTVEFGQVLTVTSNGANLLSNDSDDIDVGNQPLSVVTPALREPRFDSEFELRSDGGFTYVPDPDLDFSSSGRIADSFEYRITDGELTGDATAVINIVGEDQPPVIDGPIPELEVVVGIEADISLADFFIDPEGAEMTFAIVSGLPEAGTLRLSSAGRLEGLAARADIGSWQVVVSASDASSIIDAIFTLTVVGNLPPESEPIPDQQLARGDSLNLNISRYFDDPEDQDLVFSLSGTEELQINRSTGLITGTPVSVGDIDVSVTAFDGFNLGVTETFELSVIQFANRAPVFTGSISDQTVSLGTGIEVIQGDFSDPDNDPLSYRIIGNLPAGLVLNPSGTITGIPTRIGTSGVLRIRAIDPDGLSVNSNFFRITVTTAPVNPGNRPPIFTGSIANQTVEVDEDITAIQGQFSDPDGDDLTYTVTGNLPDGLEINDTTGRITGEPEDTGIFAGLRIVATDEEGLSGRSNSFTITVFDEDDDDDDDPARIREDGGLVSLEAERFDSTLTAGDHSWVPFVNPSAASALGVQALPDRGLRLNTPERSPALTYRVRFNAAGTFAVWVRGLGIRNGNSLHVGLNNQVNSVSQNIQLPLSWGWSNDRANGTATITIPSAGVHTINVWMREDGVSFDKLVLTRSVFFEPSADGPPETINPDF